MVGSAVKSVGSLASRGAVTSQQVRSELLQALELD